MILQLVGLCPEYLNYVKRRRVASLTGIFKHADESVQDTDKLVDLFRNRSELKKEFASLRNEKYQLEDRIKEHRAAIERVQQKLNHLEALLLDPDWVHNVVTFYQLRRLGAHFEARLARFAEQLKQQREKRIRDKTLAAWKARVQQKRSKVEAAIGEHRQQLQRLEDQLQRERHKLDTMSGLSKLMHGKTQAENVTALEDSLRDANEQEAGLLERLERIENTEPPPQEGLDIAAKRSINFMILSFAQQLFLHYHEDNLARMAKEASDKSVGAVNYGSKLDCDEILENLARRREEVEKLTDSTETLQERAKHIARHALFRDDDDAVPSSSSVATVFDIMPNGAIGKIDANLLGENYFGITKVLSR